MNLEDNGSENAALIAFAEERQKPPEVGELTYDGITIPIIVDNDGKAESLAALVDRERPHPRRRVGTAKFTDQTSFEDHTNRFKSEHSTLWADRGDGRHPKLTSVLDYHELGHAGKPAFGQHRGIYTFPVSDEWEAWSNGHNQPMKQAEFAAFIEERLVDVVDAKKAPEFIQAATANLGVIFAPPTALLKLARGIKVHTSSEVSEEHSLSSGESEVTFRLEHTDGAGQKVRIPDAFVISIPIFRSGESVSLAVFLRYRVVEKRIMWFFSLYRAQQAFDEAFQFACDAAQKATELPLYFGTPES